MQGSDAALLGGGQLGGNGEVGQIAQRLIDFFQALFEDNGMCREGVRGVLVAGGGLEQGAAIAAVGNRPGAHQGEGLAGAKRTPLDGGQHGVLFVGGQRAQALGQGGADRPRAELELARTAQAMADGEAAFDPGAAFAEPAGNLAYAVAVLVDERTDDAGFIDRGEGPCWGVGGQQQAFVFGASCGRFDHHGELAHALLGVGCQALEAVDDLEVVGILGGHDADGQRCGIAGAAVLGRAGTQRGIGGAQTIDGDHAHRIRVKAHRHGALRMVGNRRGGSRRP